METLTGAFQATRSGAKSDFKIHWFLIRSGILSPSKKKQTKEKRLCFLINVFLSRDVFHKKDNETDYVCTFNSWTLGTKCERCSIRSAICDSASFSLPWSDLRSSRLEVNETFCESFWFKTFSVVRPFPFERRHETTSKILMWAVTLTASPQHRINETDSSV